MIVNDCALNDEWLWTIMHWTMIVNDCVLNDDRERWSCVERWPWTMITSDDHELWSCVERWFLTTIVRWTMIMNYDCAQTIMSDDHELWPCVEGWSWAMIANDDHERWSWTMIMCRWSWTTIVRAWWSMMMCRWWRADDSRPLVQIFWTCAPWSTPHQLVFFHFHILQNVWLL